MSIAFRHHHVGITVAPDDLNATIGWYAHHLGFRIGTQFDMHGTTFTYLSCGDVTIELLAGASHGPGWASDDILTSMDPSRLHHFCLAVDDLDDTVMRLQASGATLIGGPMDLPDIGRRAAFFTDNLGTIIEFISPCT